MQWDLMLTSGAGAVGAAGVLAMLAAFVLTARRGGWDRAMMGPIREKRWPAQRRLMATGAGLQLVFVAVMGLLIVADALYWAR